MILNALVTCSATVSYSAKIMPHTLSENYILLPHFIYKINALKKKQWRVFFQVLIGWLSSALVITGFTDL